MLHAMPARSFYGSRQSNRVDLSLVAWRRRRQFQADRGRCGSMGRVGIEELKPNFAGFWILIDALM